MKYLSAQVCEFLVEPDTTLVWDNEQQVPFAYNGDQWVGFDDPRSIGVKVCCELNLVKNILTKVKIVCCEVHIEESFQNVIKSNQNQTVFTIFRLIWNTNGRVRLWTMCTSQQTILTLVK